jgi:hypothetical protein
MRPVPGAVCMAIVLMILLDDTMWSLALISCVAVTKMMCVLTKDRVT